jgi:hypothetical protein
MSPSALFGGPLLGDKLVRFIYVDEAGTSEQEPVSVVVGLIVQADKEWLPAAQAVQSLRPTVPEKFRNEIFHAKTIWGHKKYRDDWSQEARVEFLCRLMSIPNRVGIGISWAMMRRTARVVPVPGYTAVQIQHAHCFLGCVGAADTFVRQVGPGEVATIVAEDVPEVRKLLRHALTLARYQPPTVTGWGPSPATELRVTQVVDEVHFAGKEEAILLQVADACAFGLRRYFADQSYGDVFAHAVTGGAKLEEIFHKADQSISSAGGTLGPSVSPSAEPSSGQSS